MASAAAQKAYAASGSPKNADGSTPDLDAWFQNAVQAGVFNPDGSTGGSNNFNEGGGYNYSSGATGPSGLQPGQTPTPDQLRKFSREKNWQEDFNRMDDATLQQWINNSWDPQAQMFHSEHGGALVEKPSEVGAGETFGGGSGGSGGGGGAGTGATAAPAAPTTFGNQLSLTGNPLQDMLVSQFNTGANSSYTGANLFGLGDDFKVGGTDANADDQSKLQAQSLSGGGLWWGQGKDTFGGFRADEKNSSAATAASPAAPKPQEAAAAPSPTQNAAAPGAVRYGGVSTTAQSRFAPAPVSPVGQMLGTSYNGSRPPTQPTRFF